MKTCLSCLLRKRERDCELKGRFKPKRCGRGGGFQLTTCFSGAGGTIKCGGGGARLRNRCLSITVHFWETKPFVPRFSHTTPSCHSNKKKKKSAWGKVALNNNKNYVYVNNENQGPSLFPGKRTASKNRCWHSPGEIASRSSSSSIQAPDPAGEKKNKKTKPICLVPPTVTVGFGTRSRLE